MNVCVRTFEIGLRKVCSDAAIVGIYLVGQIGNSRRCGFGTVPTCEVVRN